MCIRDSYQCGAPIGHEQEHDNRYQYNTFYQVVQYCFGAVVHQVVSVVEYFHLHIRWQHFGVQLCNLFFQPAKDLAWVFAFAHYYNALYYVVAFIQAHLPHTWSIAFQYIGYVLYQYRVAILVSYNCILYVCYRICLLYTSRCV